MWADNETDIDLLGFDFLVDCLVVALTEPRLLPLTVGVLGDWGSGKSSLMRIAKKDLSSPGQQGKPSRYLTVDFSPWQYEDYEDVKIALMNSVLDALEKRAPAEQADRISRLRTFVGRFKRWGRRLGRVGTSAAPTILPVLVQAIDPSVGPEAANIMKAATTAIATEADRALARSEEPGNGASENVPLTDITRFRADFTTLVEAIPETDAVIVFIDDLDRCLPETVVDTFEAIRLFLNTPKTAYVLALNQAVVESAIDSRYPELTKADGAGIGRDYLEKMLQLKVAIPPLSAPEAETYVNLLFAELRLPPSDFAKVLQTSASNRAQSSLAVGFNLGIAGGVLGDIPSELSADLSWAANISPVLGPSLRGNPRQLKRFLNNLLLKNRSAMRRNVSLELPVLAKLMVLEDQHLSDFQKIFDWQMTAPGSIAELSAAESYARSLSSADSETQTERKPNAKTKSVATKRMPAGPAVEQTSTQGSALGQDLMRWANKAHIAAWLRLDPEIGSIDLRPYFTYSRDKLTVGASASRLSPRLQQLLVGIQNDVDAIRRSHYEEVSALDPSERAQLMEALFDRVRRQPSGIAITAALEIAEHEGDVVQSVCDALAKIPASSIPATAASAAVRRLPNDHPSVITLLDHWEASENSSLKSVLVPARAASARREH